MKKFLLASTVMALFGVSVTMAVMAQPPEGDRPEGPPPGGPGERGPGERGPGREGWPPMPNPLMAALDKNGDREISADELKEATTSLLTLDKNGDGKLTDDETRPPRPEGARFFPPAGEFRPEGGPPGRGPGDGPPFRREGAGRGDGPPEGREGGGRSFGPFGPPGSRDAAGRGEGPPGRGPGGPPNPERFVEEAMRFDADRDGKLDKAELTKFAVEMTQRQGPPPDEGRPGRGPRRPDGDRPPGDRPPGERDRDGEGDRPERPEAE